MDISTIIGLVIGFGSLIGGFLMEHGLLSSLVLPSPFLIVVGGTLGAVILSNGLKDSLSAVKSLFKSYSSKNNPNPEKLIQKISEMAELCRREGLLKLQSMLADADLNNDNYLPLRKV